MKRSMMSFAVAFTAFQSVAALAIWNPNWERPILRADMIEVDAQGHELGIGLDKVLTMNKRDGATQPTSLDLMEEHKVFCVRAPCPPIKKNTRFVILSKKTISCGSTQYVALDQNVMFPGVTPSSVRNEPGTLTLVDHATRICDDYKKYRWEASLNAPGRGGVRKRLLLGNPKAVPTIE